MAFIATSLPAEQTRTVDPLILPVWHQDNPWNARCPGQGPNRANAGSHALALAKIMKYWAYPTYGTGSVSYVDDNFGPINQNFTSEIMWNNMSNTLVFQTTQRFIFMCGASIHTDYEYDFSSSSLTNVRNALINNFSYDDQMQYLNRSAYTNFYWKSAIRQELDAARPVIYMAVLANGNEVAFLIDGYDEAGLFHINWSDQDYTDGWFDLNNLSIGTEAIPANNQHMLTGIQPSNGPDNIDENFETDFSNWNWQFSGHQNWTISTEEAYYGSQSAKSGNIDDNQYTSMFIQINVTNPDTISFYKKVSCEPEANDLYDHLAFFIDNVEKERWSGDGSWAFHQYAVTPGVHEFRWTYSKDGASDYYSDCAWVDAIDLPEGTTPLNAPQFVEAEVINGNDIQIGWAAPPGTNPTLLGYKVYRNGSELVQFSNPGIHTYIDANLPNGEYTYVVRGVYVEGISGPSNSSAVTVEVPYAPQNLTATLSGINTAHLSWAAPPLLRNRALMGYIVYRDNAIIAQIESPEVLEYNDPALPLGVYYYEVSAVYSVGESVRSNMAQLAVGVPAPPGNLQAVVNGSTVNLSWSQVPQADFVVGFKVFRNATLIATINSPTQLQYSDTNLPNGVYSYYVRAVYIDAESGNSATVMATVEVLYPPASLVATVNGDDVQLSWQNPEATRALTNYYIYRNGQIIAATFGAGSTMYLDQNLYNGSYTYQVTAVYSGVQSAFSNSASALVEVLYPPTNLNASVNLANVHLSWTLPVNHGGLRGLNGYNIYRNSVLVGTLNSATANSYNDNGVINGLYTYEVKAVYSTGMSTPATISNVLVEVLYPVSGLSYQVTDDDVALSWNAPATSPRGDGSGRNLAHYNVYRGGALIGHPTELNYMDANLANGVYAYYVTAVYGSGESEASQTVYAEVEVHYPPTGLMATVDGDDVTLSWTAPVTTGGLSRALNGYRVYRNGALHATVAGLTYHDNNLANGSYEYYVLAVYAGGLSAPSNTASVVVEVLYPPSNLQAVVQNRNNIALSWQAPPTSGGLRSLVSYQLLRNGALLQETTDLTYNDNLLADGTYTYQVQAVYGSGTSLPTNTVTRTIQYPYPPANINTAVNGADVTITWDAVPGTGVQYRLYRNNALLATSTQTSYLDAGLNNGSYNYYIITINASDSGPSDASQTSTAVVSVTYPPRMLTGNVVGSTVSLAWTAPANGPRVLVYYQVYRDGSMIGSTTGLTYTDAGLGNGSYSYYVTAVYDNGESLPSNIVVLEVEILYPPTDLTASVFGDDVSLSWTAASTGRALQGYSVYRDGIQITQVNTAFYTDLNLANGSYSYYVKAVYVSGTSVASNTVNVTVEVPYAPSALVYTTNDDAVMLSWTAAPNSALRSFLGYNIYRDGALITTSQVTNYTDSGMSNGIYQYYVTANYSSGESQPTNTVTVNLEVLYPATGLSCQVLGDDVSLSWQIPVTSGGLRNLLGYKVLRDGVQIAFVNVPSYQDNDLANGIYHYSVVANYASGDALPTGLVQAVVEVLYPPTGLTYSVSEDTVSLSWTVPITAARGLVNYHVYRNGLLAVSQVANTWVDSGLANGSYEYYVTAVYNSGESIATNTVQATVEVLYPPTGLSYTVNDDDVSLQWSAAAVSGGLRSFNGYDLYRDGALLIHTNNLNYTDLNLPNGTYSYYVTATYDSGTSLPTAAVSVLVEVYYPATGLSASVNADDVTLSWTAAVTAGGLRDITGYRIYRDGAELAYVNTTTYQDLNLANGSYQYYVVAVYSTGNAAPSNTATAFVEVAYPATGLECAVQNNTVSLSWTAAANAGGLRNLLAYLIYRNGTYLGQTTLLNYTDTGLANGTYQYYIIARYSAGDSVPSNLITAEVEVPYAATSLSATVADDNVTLHWSVPATNGYRALMGYFIYRNNTLHQVLDNPGQTTWIDYGLANGEYSYYLEAVYASGLSLPSNTVTVNVQVMPDLFPPTGLTALVTGVRDVSLAWNVPSASVQFYRIYRNAAEMGTSTNPNFQELNLPNGSYTYYVKAQYAEGLSSASAAVTVNIMMAEPPTALAAEVVNSNYAHLNWTAPAQGEIGYLIYRNGIELHYLANTQNVSYTDGPLANGNYSYQVAAVYATVISNLSAPVQVAIAVIYPPDGLSGTVYGNAVQLTWNAPSDQGGLLHYLLKRDSATIAEPVNTNYTDMNLANGDHQYTVAAVYSNGESNPSAVYTASIQLTYPPSALNAIASGSAVDLSWTDVSDPGGFLHYLIYRNGTLAGTSVSPAYHDATLPNGSYSYFVSALYGVGESTPSNTVSVTVEEHYPATALQANVVDNDVILAWAAPATSGGLRSLLGYKVYRNGAQIATIQQTAYTDLDLSNGAYQYYIVATYNTGDSAPSNTANIVIETLYPAANLVYQVSGSTVNLAWDAVPPSGATLLGYNVYRNGMLQNQTTTTTYSDTGLDNGSYSYYVSARYASGVSLPTNTVVAVVEVTYAPTDLIAQVNGADVALNWTPPANGPRSLLYYEILRNSEYLATVLSANYLDPHPGNGTHSYVVRAVYSAGTSEPSNTAVVNIFVVYPPAGIAIQQLEYNNQITLSWSPPVDSGGFTSFRVYRNNLLQTTTTNTSYQDNNLINGIYTYYVTCMYGTQESTPSSNATGTVIMPHAPTDLVGGINGSSVSLDWSQPSDAWGLQYYEVWMNSMMVQQVNITTTTIPNLDNGSYTFYIKAVYPSGQSAPTNTYTASILNPNPPQNVSNSVSGNTVTLNWDVPVFSGGLSNYGIYRDNVLIGHSVSTSYQDTSLANANYHYTVVAFYGTVQSSQVDAGTAHVEVYYLPANPQLAVDQGSVTFTWSAVDPGFFMHYRVYRNGAIIADLNSTTFTDQYLPNGSYTYSVAAVYESGSSAVTTPLQAQIMVAYPPQNLSDDAPGNVVYLSWDAPADVFGLSAYRITRNDQVLGNITGTGYTDAAIPNGPYTYRITALYANEQTASAEISLDLIAAYPVQNFTAEASQNDIVMNWTAPADTYGLTGYQVMKNVMNNNIVMAELSADQLACTLSDVPNGIWRLWIRTVYGNVQINQQNPITVNLLFAYPPVNLTAHATADTCVVNLAWEAPGDVTGFTSYRIFRNDTLLTEQTGLSYVDTVAPNGTNTYSVKSIYGANLSEPVSASCLVHMAVPARHVTAVAANVGYLISWQAPAALSQPDYYEVYFLTDGHQDDPASWVFVTSVDSVVAVSDGGHINGGGDILWAVLAMWNSGDGIPAFSNVMHEGPDVPPTPEVTTLKGNFPNPFNPDTTIAFDLHLDSPVKLQIFNIRGQLVRTLVNESYPAGAYQIPFDGKDDHGRGLGSGVYIYMLKTHGYTKTMKMTLVK